jgi:hypothetical protein
VVTASAPGKIMLAGEYAVLLGGRTLAVTIDRRLTVTAERRGEGEGIRIASNLWPEPRTLARAAVDDPDGPRKGANPAAADPLTAAVAFAARHYGLTDLGVTVASDLAVHYGVGSSSALRLSVILALGELAPAEIRLPRLDAARYAWLLQREAQSFASGYDVATQLVGGLVEFRNPAVRRPMLAGPSPDNADQWPVEITRHERLLEPARELVHPFVGGRGAPTGKVLGETLAWLGQAGRVEALGAASEELVEAFHGAFAARFDAYAQARLIAAVAQHRQIFAGSPHDPTGLHAALSRLPDFDETWTFKTTGAGGEDAILLVGEPSAVAVATDTLYRMGWDRLRARFAADGAAAGGEGPSA